MLGMNICGTAVSQTRLISKKKGRELDCNDQSSLTLSITTDARGRATQDGAGAVRIVILFDPDQLFLLQSGVKRIFIPFSAEYRDAVPATL